MTMKEKCLRGISIGLITGIFVYILKGCISPAVAADINVTDQYGLSPLVYALKTKNKALVDLIRSAGGEY